MKKIGWLQTVSSTFGGERMNSLARQALGLKFDVDIVKTHLVNESGASIPKRMRTLFKLVTMNGGSRDCWILNDYFGCALMSSPFFRLDGKRIAYIHHIDIESQIKGEAKKKILKTIEQLCYRNLHKLSCVVAVSDYWKRWFENMGATCVEVVYAGLPVNQFSFKEEEITDFKQRYNLTKKPIIYLGNCRKEKGAARSYDALKHLDAHFVTSGKREVMIPALNLDIPYRDYQLLLAAADVAITMSEFKEGWCVTAHEAMLCGTPVIGSGEGGMRELLEGGKQLICEDYSRLSSAVKESIEDPTLGEKGRAFASTFTTERFNQKWQKIVQSVIDN